MAFVKSRALSLLPSLPNTFLSSPPPTLEIVNPLGRSPLLDTPCPLSLHDSSPGVHLLPLWLFLPNILCMSLFVLPISGLSLRLDGIIPMTINSVTGIMLNLPFELQTHISNGPLDLVVGSTTRHPAHSIWTETSAFFHHAFSHPRKWHHRPSRSQCAQGRN